MTWPQAKGTIKIAHEKCITCDNVEQALGKRVNGLAIRWLVVRRENVSKVPIVYEHWSLERAVGSTTMRPNRDHTAGDGGCFPEHLGCTGRTTILGEILAKTRGYSYLQ